MRERRDRVNFFYALEEQALSKTNGDKTFLIYQDSSWTYKQTYELAIKYGNWFKTTYDIKPGEIVAMDFMNSPKFIFMMWGLWSIGATPAFLNYNLTSKPLLHCVKTSSARYLFVDDEVKASITPEVVEALSSDTFRDDGGAVEIIYVDAALEGLIAKINPERPPDKLRAGVNMYAPNSICCLIYTSGTTGMPKPAICENPTFRMTSTCADRR